MIDADVSSKNWRDHVPSMDTGACYDDICFGCKVIRFKEFRDERGYLVPVWSEDAPEHMYVYYSVTAYGAARDADRWHVHVTHTDRFVVIHGQALFALSDGKSFRSVALSGNSPAMLIVPPGVYHCFRPYGVNDPITVLNLPSEIYDPGDEGRVPFDNLSVERPW